jgi:hypothetical protein
MDGVNMAEKLWDLANLITGFAVVQILATTFAMAKDELRTSLKGRAAHWTAFTVAMVFTAFYVTAIMWCGLKGSSLDDQKHSPVWSCVTAARVVAVVLFTVVGLGTLYGHRMDELRRQSTEVTDEVH